MTELVHQKWFKPALFSFCLFLLLGFLLFFFFQHTAGLPQDTAFRLLLAPGSITANCITQREAPLYPLLIGIFYKWRIAPSYATALVNIVLFLALCGILYRIVLRYLDNRFLAALPVLLYGFSASSVSAVSHAEPALLSGLLAAACFLTALRMLEKRTHFWDPMILFAAVLLGFLTEYDFALFTLCFTFIFCGILLFRRECSTAITLAVTSMSAILIGFVLFPASIVAIAQPDPSIPARYGIRLLGNLSSLSARLFAGGMLYIAVGFLLIVGVLSFRPSKLPEKLPITPGARDADPAAEAYQRRILRRIKKAHAFSIPVTGRTLFACAVFAIGILYIGTFSVRHCNSLAAGLFLLEPLIYIFTICAAYRLLSKLVRKQVFLIVTITGAFLLLNLFSLF